MDPFMASASIRRADEIGMRDRWTEGWSHYLSAGVCHPYAAPCTCSRLAGVAPALILSAEDDPLLDETLGFAGHLKTSGVNVHQHVLPAGTGWPSLYGGTSDETASWQGSVTKQFSGFIKEISIH